MVAVTLTEESAEPEYKYSELFNDRESMMTERKGFR